MKKYYGYCGWFFGRNSGPAPWNVTEVWELDTKTNTHKPVFVLPPPAHEPMIPSWESIPHNKNCDCYFCTYHTSQGTIKEYPHPISEAKPTFITEEELFVILL